jgi:hypothetical protein
MGVQNVEVRAKHCEDEGEYQYHRCQNDGGVQAGPDENAEEFK